MMYRYLILFSLFIQGIFAQSESFSLEQAKAYALDKSIQAGNSRSDLESARYRVREAVSSGLLQVNASANYNYNFRTPVFIFPDFINGNPDEFVTIPAAPLNSAVLGANASMLLFSGSYLVGIQAANEFLKLTMEQNDLTAREVKEQVSRAYFMTLIANASADWLDSSLRMLEKTVEDTRALLKEGFIESIELEQLELTLLQTRDGWIQASNARKLSLMSLKLAMGYPLSDALTLSDDLGSMIAQINWNELLAAANAQWDVSRMPEHRLMSRRLLLNDYQVKLQQSAALPTLVTGLTYQYNVFNNQRMVFAGNGNVWAEGGLIWGLNMQIPVFSSLERTYKLKQVKLERLKVSRELEQVTRGLETKHLQSVWMLEEAIKRFETAQKAFELAAKIRGVNHVKYKEGLINSFMLTQSEQQYFDARQRYYQSIFELLTAKLDVDKSVQKL
jgi:outer membrane protein